MYAAKTEVSPEKTRVEIERTLSRYGATAMMIAVASGKAMVTFEASDRRVRFSLTLPKIEPGTRPGQAKRIDQTIRSRWRGLLLCIKAKLESVESGIETFEEAFFAHVVMPDGSTVYESAREMVALSYQTDTMQALLPGPSR